jgi:hypothetical protein
MTNSIHRDCSLPADVQEQDVVGNLSPSAERRAATAQPGYVRRAEPVASLLPRTQQWIASLPVQFRPVLLAAQFARVANHLCAAWNEPVSCRRYLQSLLIDRRGNRKGFPHGVLRELLALRSYLNSLHPTRECAWETVEPAKR